MGKKCVKCGGHNTGAYFYGMPMFDEVLEKDLAEHKIFLGGCMVTEFDPMFHCNKCNQDFGYSPKCIYDDRIVDYIEDTNYFMFSINYPQFGEIKFTLLTENDKFYARS